MLAQAQIRNSALVPAKYTAPAIDLDSRRVSQEEWGFLIVGAIVIGTIWYVTTCDGSSSISFSWDGVSANCSR